ncbi:ABC transporter permease [Mucilaginibacter lacusdianchii]|uniref:ABC transporter permease n=1 Tax=Mucilaginibacter lacusdianchii TaxID=2684211 RepID=UPI00131E9B85|nr:ABC transporter permease [Mucilaginibacter sp. JXJ CY 39]
MIRNYLRSALRNIGRYKFIAFINIAGLTLGLTCCLLILAYNLNELSYDRFNSKADRVYRITRSFNNPDGTETLHLGAISPPFGPFLKNEFPEIEQLTRLYVNGDVTLRYKDKLFNEQGCTFADDNFFEVFTADVVKGNPKTALTEPYSVMLTDDMARKYFGSEDPINKEIRLENKINFKVTGIFKPFPANSHIHPQILLSFSTLNDSAVYGKKQLETNWGNNSFYTYLLLPPNYNAAQMESRFPAFLDKYMRPADEPSSFKASAGTKLTLQRLADIHLHSQLDSEIEENGDIKRVYIFSAIAVFILLIACINYMNLSTARATLRAKEIGIRKVIGADRKQLITQFLGESALITYLSFGLAFTLLLLLLPAINKASNLGLSSATLLQPVVLLPILVVPFIIGILSGIYPAVFMSSFKPVKVLKGIFKAGGGLSFRKVLVVTQFAISIILIVATTVVFQQLRYLQNKSLGLNKDHIIMLRDMPSDKFGAFTADLLKSSAIKNIGRSSRVPSGRLLDDQGVQAVQNNGTQPVNATIKYINTDYGFIPTFNIKMAAGRNFSRSITTDSNNYVLNVSATKALGWQNPGDAIGQNLNYGGVSGKIIGVVNDFHFESLHQQIAPLLMRMPNFAHNNYHWVAVKVSGQNVKQVMNTIQQTWEKYQPEKPFTYNFLDERFNMLYHTEQQEGQLFTIFSCIAIFIACLGLFGLSAFTISQRVKEIGVRKVLGASVRQIVTSLSVDFLKLVLVASVIALPIAWYAMNKWLLDFAFRINISWWVLAMAGVLAIVIAFATISFQSIKAAMANPVNSLRNE